ncbi:MAG: ABC transporter permease, partial [Anaerolineae bacterium]|nr:ABC transporter permease [Anaerolineae bacterium]
MKEITLYTLALQNLRRKPYRAVVIGLCVAVATGSLFAATIVLRGVQHSLTVGRARLGADLIIVPDGYELPAQEAFITGQPSTFYMPDDLNGNIAALPGVQQTSAQVFVETLSNASCCIGEFFLVGFEPETDFTISPWLATHLGGETLDDFDIIVGDRILLREGETVIFYGTAFSVVGVLEKTGMGID